MTDNEVVLTMLSEILRTTFSDELLDANVHIVRDMYSKSLTTAITRIKIPYDAQKTIVYPDGWWNAVKDRFIPKFLKRIIRIRYIIVDVYRIFPELPPETKELLGRSNMSVSIRAGITGGDND